ncbi:MAG TPA: hypothetical protein VJ870_04625 [Amycolatopsis sp.]|nr:hypothetical protein [Amycolatopsis sp.]
MSLFEVLSRFGTAALLRFVSAVVLFLLLHLLRIPLVLIARVLEIAMCRANAYAARQASQAPRGPINQFFHPGNGFRGEATNVHA